MGTLGSWLTNDELYTEAEPLLLQALAMGTDLLGPDHVSVAIMKTGLAKMYLARGRTDDAEAMANSAREVFASQLPEDHWRIAWVEGLQGAVLTAALSWVGARSHVDALAFEIHEGAKVPVYQHIIRSDSHEGGQLTYPAIINVALQTTLDFGRE